MVNSNHESGLVRQCGRCLGATSALRTAAQMGIVRVKLSRHAPTHRLSEEKNTACFLTGIGREEKNKFYSCMRCFPKNRILLVNGVTQLTQVTQGTALSLCLLSKKQGNRIIEQGHG